MDHQLLTIKQLMKVMFLDYQSLTVVILVSIFGLLLVVVVKDIIVIFIIALVLLVEDYSPSFFVGNNYYCESGSVDTPVESTYYFNDTLWDGEGCVDNCCDDTTQPWFYRQLNQTTQDDIEARICDEGPFSRMATLIDQLELYIQ